MHSVTFWNFLHAFWNILESLCDCIQAYVFICIIFISCLLLSCIESVCVHSLEFVIGTQTDRQTDIRTCGAASSQLKIVTNVTKDLTLADDWAPIC